MSVYTPRTGTLYIEGSQNAWFIYDSYGIYDGPYESYSDAAAVIQSIEKED